MNFGQALSTLLNHGSVSRTGWARQHMSLALHDPTGSVNERFIVQRFANGDCHVYTPNQEDILAHDWAITGGAERTMAHQHEPVGVESGAGR